MPLLVEAYNSSITDPQQLVDVLRFSLKEQCTVEGSILHGLSQAFIMYLKRYLSGRGHVDHQTLLDFQLLTREDIDRERDNAVLRARMFLKVATSAVFLPAKPYFTIQVCVRNRYLSLSISHVHASVSGRHLSRGGDRRPLR